MELVCFGYLIGQIIMICERLLIRINLVQKWEFKILDSYVFKYVVTPSGDIKVYPIKPLKFKKKKEG
jgi:hypothetical protein